MADRMRKMALSRTVQPRPVSLRSVTEHVRLLLADKLVSQSLKVEIKEGLEVLADPDAATTLARLGAGSYPAVTLDEMLAAATRKGEPYQIVHFDGHGTFLKEIQLGALCFEKADDDALKVGTDMVRADRIGDLLAAHKVPLAILEACQSAEIGPTAAFRSVAPRLLDAGVGSVLAMSHAVHIEATRVLLENARTKLLLGLNRDSDAVARAAALLGLNEQEAAYLASCRMVKEVGSTALLMADGERTPLMIPRWPERVHRIVTKGV